MPVDEASASPEITRRLHRREGEGRAPGRARAAMGGFAKERYAQAKAKAEEALKLVALSIAGVVRGRRSPARASPRGPDRAGAGDRAFLRVPGRAGGDGDLRRLHREGRRRFTLVNFVDFFRTDLFLRSFWNSLYVSAMAVVGASVLALPLAYITSRFTFRGTALIQTLGFLPLIMPPSSARWRCSCSSAATAGSICCSTTGSASRSRSWRASTASSSCSRSTTFRSS